MATLERIRRRSGLLIVVIGLAMLAFILTDLFSSGDSLLRGDQNIIGTINGVSIEYQEFNSRIDKRLEALRLQNPQQVQSISRVMLAEQIWSEYEQEILMNERYKDLGISVTDDELVERIKNNDQIKNVPAFKDQVTGQFSMSNLTTYVENLKDQASSDQEAAQMYNQWVDFEKGVFDQALLEKYQYVVRKGLYVPTKIAQELYNRRQENKTANFFGLSYSDIADSTIEFSEGDLKSYYTTNKSEFEAEESRSIAFVTFPVGPSNNDRNAIINELKSYLQPEIIKSRGRVDTFPSFQEAEDDSIYAIARSDENVFPAYLTKDQIKAPLDSTIIDQEAGYIYGPYENSGAYILTKVSDVAFLPDSVNARHILISYQGANNGQSTSTRPPQEAQALADSLYNQLKEDTTGFSNIAKELSDDKGSGAKGGNLEWFNRGAMVKAFENFCFLHKTGEVGMVYSQFGIHIINILEQKGSNRAVKLVEIRRFIEPSDDTRDSIYNKANEFAGKASAGEDFGAIAIEMGYSPRPVEGIEPMQEQILGIGQNREIVRWSYEEETELGEVSLFNNQNRSFIVAVLSGISYDGLNDFELVKSDIEAEVIKEKKAEMLVEKINSAKPTDGNIEAWAKAAESTAKVQALNFASSSLQDFGSEPSVIGYVTGAESGAVFGPMVGDRGVYVGKVNSVVPGEPLVDYTSEKLRLQTEMSNLAPGEILESLREGAIIEDKRARFF